tara:strand:+ start:694 stop:906 length:213 start_codon:yes stop_codon:yes gene_type:complete
MKKTTAIHLKINWKSENLQSGNLQSSGFIDEVRLDVADGLAIDVEDVIVEKIVLETPIFTNGDQENIAEA